MNSRWVSTIDKLPNSNVYVLAFWDKKIIIRAFYAAKNYIEVDYDDGSAIELCEDDNCYYLKEGWHEAIESYNEYSSIHIHGKVTHWMPLPEIPE